MGINAWGHMRIGGPIKPARCFSLCNNHAKLPRVVAVVLLAALLPACSASQFSGMPSLLGGETANTPRESPTPPAFPAVHDMPAARPVPVLTDAQQKQAEAELVAARDKQIGAPAKSDAQKKVADKTDKKSTEKKQQTAAKQQAPTTASNENQGANAQ
jgi:hypothetical protein